MRRQHNPLPKLPCWALYELAPDSMVRVRVLELLANGKFVFQDARGNKLTAHRHRLAFSTSSDRRTRPGDVSLDNTLRRDIKDAHTRTQTPKRVSGEQLTLW
jgi:hypothetical protein